MHIGRERLQQPLRPFVKRSGRLDFAGQEEIVCFRVRDASGRHRRREVDEVQTVVGLKPEIRDEQIGRLQEKSYTSGLKVGASVDSATSRSVLRCARLLAFESTRRIFDISGQVGRPFHGST